MTDASNSGDRWNLADLLRAARVGDGAAAEIRADSVRTQVMKPRAGGGRGIDSIVIMTSIFMWLASVPPRAATPVPVEIVNEINWLDITTGLIVPGASLVVSVFAVVVTVRARRQVNKIEAARREADVVRAEQEVRRQYARRMSDFARHTRDGALTSATEFSDEWRDLIKDAPDEASTRLVQWFIGESGDLEQRFRGRSDADRAQATCNLHGEIEQRIQGWERSGEAITTPSFSRRFWPTTIPPEKIEPASAQ